MASNNKIIELIASIKTIYPYYAKETDVKTLVKTWALLLQDYQDNAVEVAMLQCLKTCKMPPTPADVIEQLTAIEESEKETPEELWSKLNQALNKTEKEAYKFRFNFIEANGKTQGENAKDAVANIWNGLPEEIKSYFGSKGELIRLATTCTADDLKYEKNRFFKILPTLEKRREYKKIMLQLENKPEQKALEERKN